MQPIKGYKLITPFACGGTRDIILLHSKLKEESHHDVQQVSSHHYSACCAIREHFACWLSRGPDSATFQLRDPAKRDARASRTRHRFLRLHSARSDDSHARWHKAAHRNPHPQRRKNRADPPDPPPV